MKQPKISIMIPTYNQENFVRYSIESALSLDYENLEVVLSDDCSTDNTFKIAQEYESDSRFKAYRCEQNIGRVKNYHHLLNDLVSGEWVLNCDGDDFLINTSFFNNAMEIAETNSDIVIFSANRFKLIENTTEKIVQKTYGSVGSIDGTCFFKNYFKYNHGLFHITSLYNRKVAINANFYSSDIISSDIDSLLRIIVGKKVYHFDDVIAVWRDHDDNETKSIDAVKRADNLKLIQNLYDYYISNNLLTIEELFKWRKESYKIRVIRTGNKFLSKFQYRLFFNFISEVKKQCPEIIISVLMNYKLVLTFLFPFRKSIVKKIFK